MKPAHWLYTIPLRLRSLFRRAQVERELAAELQDHIARRTDELVRDGMDEREARYIALRELGGVEQLKEECRDARRVRPFEDLVRDLVFGLRILRKSPGFTAVVIIALALGIGANTALFSLFHQILVRNLPVKNPEELVILVPVHPKFGQLSSLSYPMYRELRDRSTVVSGMIAMSGVELNVGHATGSEKATGQLVSGNYFDVLGVQPHLGRLLHSTDDRTPGAHPVAVLSHAFWQRRFGGESSVVGQQIVLNGNSITVIGVTPPGFYGTDMGRSPDISLPVMMSSVFRSGPSLVLENAGHQFLRVMARLRPNESRAQAEAELGLLHQQIRAREVEKMGTEMSEAGRKSMLSMRLALLPGAQGYEQMREKFATPLRLLLAITVVILFITCANLANMLLARNAVRQQEIAMRLALGASRSRLARQWLTESALLSLAGGAAGILLAIFCQSALVSFLPADQRANLSSTPDQFVLAVAFAVSLATGLLFGIIPALQVSRHSSAQAQKGTERVARGFRGSLVILQIALCLPLLIVACLLLQSLRNTRLVPTGFDGRNVILASLNPGLNGYSDTRARQFFDRALQETRAIPGVEAAGLASTVVLSGNADKIAVVVEGYEPQEGEDRSPYLNSISPGYFDAMRLPIVAGRDFNERDADGPKVGIINETMARYYFGTNNPVGKRFGTDSKALPDIEIVGVVRDAKHVSIRETPEREYYLPMTTLAGATEKTLHIRAAREPRAIIDVLRARLREIDPNVPLFNIKTLEATIDESLTQDRLVAWLSTALGVLATLLATIGLYGVIAFSVARRTREVGIRLALGAQRGDIFALIVKGVGVLVVVGLAIGALIAAAGSHLLSGILFGVTAANPLAYVGAAAILLIAAAMAASLPVRRALRVNPSVALRYE